MIKSSWATGARIEEHKLSHVRAAPGSEKRVRPIPGARTRRPIGGPSVVADRAASSTPNEHSGTTSRPDDHELPATPNQQYNI